MIARTWRGFAVGYLLGLADLVLLSGSYRGHLDEPQFLSYYASFALPWGLVGALVNYAATRRRKAT